MHNAYKRCSQNGQSSQDRCVWLTAVSDSSCRGEPRRKSHPCRSWASSAGRPTQQHLHLLGQLKAWQGTTPRLDYKDEGGLMNYSLDYLTLKSDSASCICIMDENAELDKWMYTSIWTLRYFSILLSSFSGWKGDQNHILIHFHNRCKNDLYWDGYMATGSFLQACFALTMHTHTIIKHLLLLYLALI